MERAFEESTGAEPVRRPWTIVLVAWLVAVPAALLVLASLAALVVVLALGRHVDGMVAGIDPFAPERVEIGAVLVVFVAVVLLAVAWGVVQVVLAVRLLRGGGFARVLVSLLQLVLGVLALPTLGGLLVDPDVPLTSSATLVALLDVALSALLLSLLWTPRARRWFAARAQAERSARASRSSPSSITGRSFENVQRTSVRPPPGSSGLS